MCENYEVLNQPRTLTSMGHVGQQHCFLNAMGSITLAVIKGGGDKTTAQEFVFITRQLQV